MDPSAGSPGLPGGAAGGSQPAPAPAPSVPNGPTSSKLGVRPSDLNQVGDDVGPGGGGLSVFDSATALVAGLPPTMVPKNLGGASNTAVLFFLEPVPAGLQARLDEPPPGHYVIEPAGRMTRTAYEQLISASRPNWRKA